MKGDGFLKRLAISDSEIKYYTAGRAQHIGTLGRSYDKISKIPFLPDILLRSADHSLPVLHSFYRPEPCSLGLSGKYVYRKGRSHDKTAENVFPIHIQNASASICEDPAQD